MKKHNDKKYLYTAFFLDNEELTHAMFGLERTPLFKATAVPHVTVEFRPAPLIPANYYKCYR